MQFIKVDMSGVPDAMRARTFSTYVWDLVERAEGPEYERARFGRESLALISEPPGFVAQVDWATCRSCGQDDLTVKGLCYKCRGPNR